MTSLYESLLPKLANVVELATQDQRVHPASQALQTKPNNDGRRRMELIASVSRSSGLERDGDALRDLKTQEEYREFIQSKVDEYWKTYPLEGRRPGPVNGNPGLEQHKKEMEGNLLILFRKLREGLMSIQRRDAFAREGNVHRSLDSYEPGTHRSFNCSLRDVVASICPVQDTSADDICALAPLPVFLSPQSSTLWAAFTRYRLKLHSTAVRPTVYRHTVIVGVKRTAVGVDIAVASLGCLVSLASLLLHPTPPIAPISAGPSSNAPADDAGSRSATSATSPPQAAQGTEASQPADRRRHVSSALSYPDSHHPRPDLFHASTTHSLRLRTQRFL
ncbi:hypothetical protein NUW54_g10448 [Trametes sanguinea]|uniref:Uncharacterized protein n=1 Tax=Trametes sanguinea TaxID=158606 RepID=A0ACC1P0A4_9APHY|nr:hypothetical protein NUW54_g10448 [Trametes sanguinea]